MVWNQGSSERKRNGGAKASRDRIGARNGSAGRRIGRAALGYRAILLGLVVAIASGALVWPDLSGAEESSRRDGLARADDRTPHRRTDPCEIPRHRSRRHTPVDPRCSGEGSSSGIARGDFNGDGFADLAVGVPFEESPVGVPASGAFIVVYGSTNGLTATDADKPASQFWSQNSAGVPDVSQANERFGSALAAGDFNGDEFSDLAIAAVGERLVDGRGAHLGPAGAVTVIYGSSDGLTTSASAGVPAARAFDFIQVEEKFGVGYGVPLAGSDDDAFDSDRSFGTSLAWGDFDGDGIGDLAVGSPKQTVGPLLSADLEAGVVAVFFGSEEEGLTTAGSQAWSQAAPGIVDTAESDDHFGSALAAGNFDGDSRTDLAIGIPDEDDADDVANAGAVAVLFGDAGGLTSSNDQLVDQVFFLGLLSDVPGTAAPNDRLGSALAAGNFDGDGMVDLAIGAPLRDIQGQINAGAVFVLRGNAGRSLIGSQFWQQSKVFGPTINPLTESATEGGDQFGFALAAGDFNFDGRADLAIGVPFEGVLVDRGSFFESIGAAGEVDVLYGSAAGLSTTGRAPQQFHQATINVEGDAQANDNFGRSLTAWNFGRDTVQSFGALKLTLRAADLAIGVPFEDIDGQSDAGGVNVLYGSTEAANGLTTASDQFWSQNSSGIPGSSEAGDRFGLTLY